MLEPQQHGWCLARVQDEYGTIRPHVCREAPGHDAEVLPHRCTCGFTWLELWTVRLR